VLGWLSVWSEVPLPLTVCCFSKIQIDFTFLVPAQPCSPGKGPLNGCVCVCVCACVCVKMSIKKILPARRYAIVDTSYGPMSVSVPVYHKSVFCRNGRTYCSGFWHGCFFRPVLQCTVRKFRYLQNKGTSLQKFFLISGL